MLQRVTAGQRSVFPDAVTALCKRAIFSCSWKCSARQVPCVKPSPLCIAGTENLGTKTYYASCAHGSSIRKRFASVLQQTPVVL